MNIIKEFEDPDFILRKCNVLNIPCSPNYEWHWGLGDDNLLYCKGLIPDISYVDWHCCAFNWEDIQRIYTHFMTPTEPKKKECICDIMVLMARGCQCGSLIVP